MFQQPTSLLVYILREEEEKITTVSFSCLMITLQVGKQPTSAIIITKNMTAISCERSSETVILLTGHVRTQLPQNSDRYQLKPHANVRSEKQPGFCKGGNVLSSPNSIKTTQSSANHKTCTVTK